MKGRRTYRVWFFWDTHLKQCIESDTKWLDELFWEIQSIRNERYAAMHRKKTCEMGMCMYKNFRGRRRRAEEWLCTLRKREPKLFAHWSMIYSYCWMIRAVWKETFTYGSVRSLRWKSSYLLDWEGQEISLYSIFNYHDSLVYKLQAICFYFYGFCCRGGGKTFSNWYREHFK